MPSAPGYNQRARWVVGVVDRARDPDSRGLWCYNLAHPNTQALDDGAPKVMWPLEWCPEGNIHRQFTDEREKLGLPGLVDGVWH